jgi:hypothetical protein
MGHHLTERHHQGISGQLIRPKPSPSNDNARRDRMSVASWRTAQLLLPRSCVTRRDGFRTLRGSPRRYPASRLRGHRVRRSGRAYSNINGRTRLALGRVAQNSRRLVSATHCVRWTRHAGYRRGLTALNDPTGAQAATSLANSYAQSAIDSAVSVYNINLSNVSNADPNQTGITFNPTLENNGQSSLDRQDTPNKVYPSVGPSAFESPGWLGSTIGHEVEAHGDQARTGTWNTDKDSAGSLLNEAQAWYYEVENSSRFGLTPDEVTRIWNGYQEQYTQLVGIDALYGPRLNQRNFSPIGP